MKRQTILLSSLLFLSTFALVYVTSAQIREPEGGSETLCARQRGDSRCNEHEDCCGGRECDSFGYCTRRR